MTGPPDEQASRAQVKRIGAPDAANPTFPRWLVLSYFANVDGMACSAHVDDRLAELRRRGIEVVLLSSVCGQPHDRAEKNTFRIASVAPSGIRFELRHWVRRHGNRRWLKWLSMLLFLPLLPFYLLEKIFVPLDSQWSWFLTAAPAGWLLARKHQSQLIYSSGGAASAHLAAALISRALKIRWVAELQDPLIHDGWTRSNWARRLYARIERLICRNADAVIFLTAKAAERAAERNPKMAPSKLHVIYPGADPNLLLSANYQRTKICRLVHLGSLAGTRNLNTFLQALESLLLESPDWRAIVQIELYGTMDAPCRKSVEAFPFAGVIANKGRIARREALEIMRQADVLLLVQNADSISSETIPSKVYEYLLAGRPILGLLSQNPELESMLHEPFHQTASVSSVAEIKDAVAQILRTWSAGVKSAPVSTHYTIPAAVDQLVKVASGPEMHF